MPQPSSRSRWPVQRNCPAAMSPWIGAGSVESRWGTAACSSARRGSTADLVEPLLAELQAAVPHLDSTDPAPIHGDMAAGQFLWTGHRLLLLGWGMVGWVGRASCWGRG